MQDFCPLSLDGGDGIEVIDGPRDFVTDGRVGSEEVVVGDEQDRERHGAIEVLEA